MTGVLAVIAAGRKRSPITVSADWGVIAGASPQTSASRTVTVPAGNPGVLRIAYTLTEPTPVPSYSINGGSFVSITDGLTITVANGDGVRFRISGGVTSQLDFNVFDNTTSTLVGTFSATIL